MISFALFDNEMRELVGAISLANDLQESLKKTIKDVFRDAGHHCKEIRIDNDGFSCIGIFSEISYAEVSKIGQYFEDYNMSIFTHNTCIAFRFTKKS